MYTAIIFDFFGVFCPDITLEWFRTVPNSKAKFSAFEILCTESNYGRLSRADFYAKVSALAGVPIEEMRQGVEAQTIINTSLVKYVKDLKKQYAIACLSNGTHEWTFRVINDHDLGELFDYLVLSGDLGIVKPSREIYEHTLEKLGASAQEVIFVDDRQPNVDAAQDLGIKSILFTDTGKFVSEFESLLSK